MDSNSSAYVNANFKELFNEAFHFYCGQRFQKLKERPVHVIYGKLLFLAAKYLNRPIMVKAKTFWGDEMFVYFPEAVSYNIYNHGFYDPCVTRTLLDYLRPEMTFLDIGAHVGYFTLLASEIVGEKGRVHSFEPTPSTFQVLKTNTLSRINVRINNCALFSKEGSLYLNDYGIQYFYLNSLYEIHNMINFLSKPIKTMVRGISVDKYVSDNHIIPDFIKIDAESAEYEIILGMEETLTKFKPFLIIEGGFRSEFILGVDFLIGKGYVSRDLENERIINKGEDVRNNTPGYNLFFYKDN